MGKNSCFCDWEDGINWDDYMRKNCMKFTQNEMELFRLWWEFLKTSIWEDWALKIQDDFRDITASAAPTSLRDDFKAWWPEHSDLFWRPKRPLALLEITDQADYSKKSQAGYMVIAIPLTGNPTRLRKDFNQLLKENSKCQENTAKPINGSVAPSGANGKYEIFKANPDSLPRRELVTKALHVHQLYAARKRLHEEAMKIYDAKLQKLQDEIKKIRTNKHHLKKTIGALKTSSLLYEAKNRLINAKAKIPRPEQIWQMVESFNKAGDTIKLAASKMPRYRAYAKNIIFNVQQGVFPKHT